LGTVRGFKTRFHLYTVPGQVFYEASRKLILKGADGVAFVADSQEERLDANFETMENLQEHLKEHNLNFADDSVRAAVEQARFAKCHAGAGADEAASKERRAGTRRRGDSGIGRVRNAERLAKLVLAELKKAGRRFRARSLQKFTPTTKRKSCGGEWTCLREIREGGGFGFEGGDGFDEAGDGESVADTTGAADQAQDAASRAS